VFPKHVLLETNDAVAAFAITLVICSLASVLAIRAALNIDPAEAISG
jgi:putative ABC transport system permease protein